MNRMRMSKTLNFLVIASIALVSSPALVLAETAPPVSATVSATILSRSTLSLVRDTNSVTRFSPSQVVFDRYDDQDDLPEIDNPNAGFMYAPYRSESEKNWHLTKIFTNGSSLSLTATVSGPPIGGVPLADILDLFCGGFFAEGSKTPLAGTKSSTWEHVEGFRRDVSGSFSGTVPFNYRLKVSGVKAGTYSGNIIFTLAST
ncbi:MAG: hypothetical protein HYZ91_07215 [Candidatus Omnitrophica bacterium]|nr:hypothetical protein [Candidatus Omnitrophota bacterium]